jgi:hypothetical protein
MSIPQFDPWVHVEQLREALDAAALDCFERQDENHPPPEACEAAFHVALALGYCRLFGIALPDALEGVLSSDVAIAAADYLCGSIERWIADARNLEMLWDQSDPAVGELLCYDLLEARMDSWAVFVAVEEAYDAAMAERESSVVNFDAAMNRLLDAVEEFDVVLQDDGTVELLSVVAGGELLGNWKRMLAEDYREPPAWWLDGGLEQVQRDLDEELAATLPRSQAQRQREQVKAVPRSRTASAQAYRSHRERILAIQPTYSTGGAPGLLGAPFWPSLKWTSPDGEMHASLLRPARAAADELLPLVFEHNDDRAAEDIFGTPVWLAGLEAQIDRQGCTSFSLAELRKALDEHRKLALEVGPGRVLWPPVPAEDADFDAETNDDRPSE